MPRIRTIKPEYWSDEKMAPLEPIVRLVFLGLISHADDAGRLIDSVRQLDGLIFPFTDHTCAEALDILARLSRVVRYRSESGQPIIQIAGWEDHQRVDRPSKHVLPPPPPKGVVPQGDSESSRHPRETLAASSRDPIAPTMDLGPTTLEHGPGTNDRGPGSEARARAHEGPVPDGLGEWLGEDDRMLDGHERILTPGQRDTLWKHYGPPQMRANGWKLPDGTSVPVERRPRIFALALSGYLAEGTPKIYTNEFALMLAKTARIEMADPAAQSGGSDPLSEDQHTEYQRIRQDLEAEGWDADAAAEEAMSRARRSA